MESEDPEFDFFMMEGWQAPWIVVVEQINNTTIVQLLLLPQQLWHATFQTNILLKLKCVKVGPQIDRTFQNLKCIQMLA